MSRLMPFLNISGNFKKWKKGDGTPIISQAQRSLFSKYGNPMKKVTLTTVPERLKHITMLDHSKYRRFFHVFFEKQTF